MPRFQDKEFSFEPPEGWNNHSVVVFAHPGATEKPREASPNIVVTREKIKEGESLRVHADKQMLQLGRQLKDFDILESRATECGGLPAIFFRYTWKSHVGELEQTITLVEKGADPDRIAMAFATTTLSSEAKKLEPVFQAILKSVKLGGGPPPPVTVPPPPTPSSRQSEDLAPVVPMPGLKRRP
jgi:hypothetical protein